MRKCGLVLILCLCIATVRAQDAPKDVTRACLDYLEGFYEGDTVKLARSLNPSLYKFGYWKNKETGAYGPDGTMSYRQALDYAKGVLDKKRFPKETAPKKVEVLDVQNAIAAAKVTAWWGVDYILLAKHGERWLIDQVLWEGPLQP